MEYSLVKLFVIVLVCHVQFSNNILLGSIYQKYLRQQGLEFRENIFLGNKPILSEYDFIIIGGGVAGSVLANRLSENPRWKVLLLESGEDENIYTNIPLLAHFNSLTHFNWGYKLEKEETHPQCLAMYNAQCPCPRGKGLGGSSILNYMIYTRGNKNDYDQYEAAGNKGWGYDSVLKYFLKSENNTSEFLDSDIHSTGGPLKITNIPYQNLLTEKFIAAACELGHPIYDYTGKMPATEGFSKLQATISKGQRYSASRAYLKSIKKRTSQNLHISIFSHVTKILIDPKTKRAHSVEFEKDGVRRIVLAKKEVILSAGAIGSPQILMVSGIGAEEHLKEFDIEVVSNLKGVGQNMRDHHAFFGLTFLMNKTNTGSTIEKQVVTIDQFLKWLKLGRGPLSVPGGVTGIGYLSTKYNTDKSWPDTEYLFTIGSFNSDSGRIFRKSMNLRKDVYDTVFGNINNREVWSILPVVLRPKTKGYIKLNSKNPFKYPKLYYDFFEHEEESEVMLEAIKNVIKFSDTEAFQSIGSRIHKTPVRECAHHEFGCDDYWRCAMRYFTSSLYHQSGTCKMGPQSDPEAVVNDELKVYGVNNLRVVDASIFPNVPSAHLYAPTVMVAEKASDMIKAEWKDVDDSKPPKNSGCYSHPNTDAGYHYNKPCNSNYEEKEKPTTEPITKPNELDNQKPQTTSTPRSTTTTSTTTTEKYSTDNKGTVPNQPDFVSGWQNYVNKTWGNKPTTQPPYKQKPSTAQKVPNFSLGNPAQSQTSQPSTNSPYIPNNQPSTAYLPYIPNQQSSTLSPYVPNQQAGSAFNAYLPNQQPSSTAYPPYIPSQQVSSTYPPYIPNQQFNGYPTQLNNIPNPSGSASGSQYQLFPQQGNGYPSPPAYQQQPNQFTGYPNQSSVYPSPSGTFTYPSDNYQIHTIYPGSSSAANAYPQPIDPQRPPQIYPQPSGYPNQINPQVLGQSNNFQSLPHPQPPVPQQQYYQPIQNNANEQTSQGNPSAPQNPQHTQGTHLADTGAGSNEIVSSNEVILFPNKHHQGTQGKHPAHQNAPQVISNGVEDINYAGLTSLHNIPYYNQYLNQLRFDPNALSRNQTAVPAAIFVNQDLLYQPPYQNYYRRNSKRLVKRGHEATGQAEAVTEATDLDESKGLHKTESLVDLKSSKEVETTDKVTKSDSLENTTGPNEIKASKETENLKDVKKPEMEETLKEAKNEKIEPSLENVETATKSREEDKEKHSTADVKDAKKEDKLEKTD